MNNFGRYTLIGFLIFSLLFTPLLYAEDTQQDFDATKIQVNGLQATDPSLPTGVAQPKGRVGDILSKLFGADGKIGSRFLTIMGTGGTILPAYINGVTITNLNASNITTGTLSSLRLPNATTGSGGIIQLSGDIGGAWNNITINGSSITTAKILDATILNADISATAAIAGTKISPNFGAQNIVTTGNITGSGFIGDGAGLTNVNVATFGGQLPAYYLNASNLNAGTIGDARLSSNVALLTGTQTFTGVKTFNTTISGSISGNAGTATALATARNIAVTGDITGTTSFNGSANVSLTGTLTNNSVITTKILDANVTLAKLAPNSVDSGKLVDASIVDADISATAAIGGTKISPNFGSQNIVTTGGVGVGTLAIVPGVKLQINGPVLLTDTNPSFVFIDTDTGADGYITANSASGSLALTADENNEVTGSRIAFNVDGVASPKMVITGTGVGIGTSTPDALIGFPKLGVLGDVNQDVKIYVQSQGNGPATIGVSNTLGGRFSSLATFPSNYTDVLFGVPLGNSTRLLSTGDNFIIAHSAATGAIIFGTSTGEIMRIDSLTKNIGIGTITPTEKLEVVGNVKATGFIGNGSGLTNINATTFGGQLPAYYLNATNINSGTLADARLSSNVALLTGAQTFAGAKTFSSLITGSISGNAGTATALQIARTISLAGPVTGSVAFNGTSNVTITGTLANNSVITTKILDSNVTLAKLAGNSVDSSKIVDSSVVDADVSATAAIAGTKISPNFGSQNVVTTGQLRATQICTSGGTGCVNLPLVATSIDGGGTANYVTRFTDANTLGTGSIFDNLTNVGIGVFSGLTEKLHVAGNVLATGFIGNGSQLTNLNATNIASGTIGDARLSSNVVLATGTQDIAGLKTFVQTNGTRFQRVSGQDGVRIIGNNTGTGDFVSSITPDILTGNRTLILADANTTLVGGTMISTTGNQTLGGNKTFSNTIIGSISGNAGTATALQTARTIALGGDVTGSASFNGGSNITITGSLAANSVDATAILNGTILNVDVNAAAAIAGTKISPNFGAQNIVTTGNVTGSGFIGDGVGLTNINATTFGGQLPAYYLNATNLNAGTIGDARLSSNVVLATGNQDIAGLKTFVQSTGTRFQRVSGQDGVRIIGGTTGTGDFIVSITPSALTANRTLTLDDGNTTLTAGTMISTIGDQTIGGNKIFSSSIGINTSPAGTALSSNSLAIGDNDTGIKQIADGILAIFTNNTERVRFSNESAASVFTLAGDSNNIKFNDTDNGNYLIHGNSNALQFIYDANDNLSVDETNNYKIFISGSASGTNLGIGTQSSGNLSVNGISIGDSDTGIKQMGDGILSILNNNTESFRVTATGGIGIGTSAPTQKLDVVGNIRASGDIMATRICTSGGTGCVNLPLSATSIDGGGTANYVTRFTDANTLGTGSIFDNLTNVGIGNASPSYKLDITGNLRATQDAVINGVDIGKGNGSLSANTIFGLNSLSVTTGSENTAIGSNALRYNTSGQINTAVGASALQNNTIGSFNTAIGGGALLTNTGGTRNNAIGWNAMRNNTTGSWNDALGNDALYNNISGGWNIALGRATLRLNISGDKNIAIGQGSLWDNTVGDSNIAIGYDSGNRTTGSNNITIGENTQVLSATGSNQLNIGNWIYGVSGNIGIGDPTPSFQLDVANSINMGGSLFHKGATVVNTDGVINSTYNLDATKYGGYQVKNNAGVVGGWFGFGSVASNRLDLTMTGSVNKLAIIGGDVGIGNTTPAYKLDITGDINTTGTIGVGTYTPDANVGVKTGIASANASKYGTLTDNIVSGTFTANRTNYGSLNRVYSDANNSTFTNTLYGQLNDAYYTSTTSPAGGRTAFGSYNRGRNMLSGNMTTAYGSYNIAINDGGGDMTNSFGTYGYSYVNSAASTTTNSYGGYFTSSVLTGAITNSYGVYIGAVSGVNTYGLYQATASADNYFAGNVGIGIAVPTEKLHVNGNVLATAFLYTSDERKKKNIKPYTNGQNVISNIQTVRYDWKDSEKGSDIGLIAQELQKIFPEAVKENTDGYLAVDYAKLVVPLIQAVQEQQKEIDELKKLIQK